MSFVNWPRDETPETLSPFWVVAGDTPEAKAARDDFQRRYCQETEERMAEADRQMDEIVAEDLALREKQGDRY